MCLCSAVVCLLLSCSGHLRTDEIDLTEKLSGDTESIFGLLTQTEPGFMNYTSLPDNSFELGSYRVYGNSIYAEAVKTEPMSQGIACNELRVMRYDNTKWETLYEYNGGKSYGRIYDICVYDDSLLWSYIEIGDKTSGAIYIYDLTKNELQSIEHGYGEIQMKISGAFLLINEFKDNENLHIIGLESEERFVYSKSELNMPAGVIFPSLYGRNVTYATEDEDDSQYSYIVSRDIMTWNETRRIKTDAGATFVIDGAGYVAWISENRARKAFLYDGGNIYSLYDGRNSSRLALGEYGGYLTVSDGDTTFFIDYNEKTFFSL